MKNNKNNIYNRTKVIHKEKNPQANYNELLIC